MRFVCFSFFSRNCSDEERKGKDFSLQQNSTMGEHVAHRNGVLTGSVLVLNQSFEPLTICSVKKAIILVLLDKAEVVEIASERRLRTVRREYPFPSVIRLNRYVRIPFRKVELSRRNIFRRDRYQCQYCGRKNIALTIDHVIPKSRGGDDTWENLVTACVLCNARKGNRTPEEAHMQLIRQPRRPNFILFMKLAESSIKKEWKQYLFME